MLYIMPGWQRNVVRVALPADMDDILGPTRHISINVMSFLLFIVISFLLFLVIVPFCYTCLLLLVSFCFIRIQTI